MHQRSVLLSASGDDLASKWRNVIRRRSFLQGIGIAGSVLPGARLLAEDNGRKLPKGDVAILSVSCCGRIDRKRFLAAIQ